MVKYYNYSFGELYRATLAESVKELSKPAAYIDWNKVHELSAQAAEYFQQAMGEA